MPYLKGIYSIQPKTSHQIVYPQVLTSTDVFIAWKSSSDNKKNRLSMKNLVNKKQLFTGEQMIISLSRSPRHFSFFMESAQTLMLKTMSLKRCLKRWKMSVFLRRGQLNLHWWHTFKPALLWNSSAAAFFLVTQWSSLLFYKFPRQTLPSSFGKH